MRKPGKIDNFKQTNHSPSACLKDFHDGGFTKIYKIFFGHELELKWIKLLQTLHPLGFNDNKHHEGNISRLPDFDVLIF